MPTTSLLTPKKEMPKIGRKCIPKVSTSPRVPIESISNRGLRGLLLNFRLLFGLHSRIPANEGLPELVIEHLRPHLQ